MHLTSHPASGRFDLTGRVAVVTGGTRGLGRAIAGAFSQAGADVVVVSRKAEACEKAAAELRADGGNAIGRPCHVGHWDDVTTLADGLHREFGRIDVLVNNAGVSPVYGRLSDVSEELWDKVFAVNLKGAFRLSAWWESGWRPATGGRSSTSAARARCGRPPTSSRTPRPRPASTR